MANEKIGTFINVQTGEEIVRPLTDEEIQEIENSIHIEEIQAL